VQAKNDPLRILLPRYSWPSEKLESSLVPAYSDYIVVEKIENGPQYETESPFLTDSVAVHYVGRLLPSTSYKDGLVFDRSYVGSYDTSLASPTKFAVNRVIVGFTTALLQMHRGDHWKVYIPYQLGYKNSTSGSVPAYSTLIFDLRLEDFWTKKRGDR
jgi:FKBP-type peptidyl-prolyl cis-trans isomerase FklB